MGVVVKQLVNYTGSLTEMHGLMHVSGKRGERFILRSAYGQKLYGVRPESFTPVETPKLNIRRAEGLRAINHIRGGRYGWTMPGKQTVAWLLDQKLVERDENGKLRVTHLGYELDAAVEIHIY